MISMAYSHTSSNSITAYCFKVHSDTDDNNNHDNVYGAVIMAEPFREFTRFIR